ncbi:hypothetical protein FC70_GL001485 [Paucilactobacillus oligofermentans DSM 15707 = LMG 22743]|uniref:Site-specific DNA-methyltransferase (adenine-specific) n=1 Tax=Paucilactobacillus oligofermentans DSM 15707 = LMG 22743 TaxID=1423778 RepID=A0A0R1RE42_9LACO|nr:DNA adenine methylase [Paucilactobacillus oligofermentans]KRL54686.1 hypothetical protein FC70_GL001485 [Paucilactobacillus oligofermentans DSM 15707 = LMG 22743]
MTKKNKNLLVRPFLKWAGGKRQLLPEIEKYLPKSNDIKNYFEPFVGGGALFLNQQYSKVTINDFNGQLTNAYDVVKNNVHDLIELLKEHENNNTSEYYYDLRAWDRTNKLENKSRLEQAARFIYLNKTGFNGLFRVNSQNQINVPYGKYKNPAIVNEKVLLNVSQYLNEANVQILNGDYADAVKNASSGDFVYFDPPYAPVSDDKSSFVGYTLNGFSLDDQIKLSEVFKELDKKGVKLMLSNSDVPFIRDLYKDFKDTTKIVQATRNINSNAAGRGKVGEVIVMNY